MGVSQPTAQSAIDLLGSGKAATAIETANTAADLGDVDAIFLLATWHLIGSPVPRDLARARGLLRRAIEIGHVDAALMEIALTANGSGSPADWGEALALLHKAAIADPVARQQLDLVDAMTLDKEGFPQRLPDSKAIGDQPAVRLFSALLTPGECAHLAQVAAPFMMTSEIVDPATGQSRPHPIRMSDGAVIGPAREDLVVAAINRRVAAVSRTAVSQGESLTVLRYSPGQQYRPHLDALPAVSNQRVKTVIIYLNQGFQGGETHFPASGLRITPRGGDAIMFDNCLADGAADPLSLHAGLPVKQGTKWIATRWIRQDPLDPWSYPA